MPLDPQFLTARPTNKLKRFVRFAVLLPIRYFKKVVAILALCFYGRGPWEEALYLETWGDWLDC